MGKHAVMIVRYNEYGGIFGGYAVADGSDARIATIAESVARAVGESYDVDAWQILAKALVLINPAKFASAAEKKAYAQVVEAIAPLLRK